MLYAIRQRAASSGKGARVLPRNPCFGNCGPQARYDTADSDRGVPFLAAFVEPRSASRDLSSIRLSPLSSSPAIGALFASA